MDPPPYEPIAGSSSSTGFAPSYAPASTPSHVSDRKGKGGELVDGEIRRWASLSSSSLSMDHPLHYIFQKDLDISKSSMRMGLVEEAIYVSPGEATVAVPGVRRDGMEGSGRVNGYLQIVSPVPRKIEGVRVRLVRRQTLGFPSGSETDEIVEKELVLDQGTDGIHLPRGVSIFEFRFLLLANSAVTEYAPCAFLQHHAVATADGSATGCFGTDLHDEQPVWAFAAPISGEVDSQRLSVHSQGMTDALGPFSYDLDASALLVSSALNVKVTLHAPPPSLTVFGVKVYLVQEARLTSHRTPAKTATIKRPKQFIVNAGPSGPYDKTFSRAHRTDALLSGKDNNGEAWTFEQVARLPSDREIRPTTHPATDTNVRTSSRLFVDVVYTTTDVAHPDSAESHKVWVANVYSKVVAIDSCACFDLRVALPDYHDGEEKTQLGLSKYANDICLCHIPWKDVRANEIRSMSERISHSSSPSSTVSTNVGGKAQGRKQGETFPGDLEVVEGVEWERQDVCALEDTT